MEVEEKVLDDLDEVAEVDAKMIKVKKVFEVGEGYVGQAEGFTGRGKGSDVEKEVV